MSSPARPPAESPGRWPGLTGRSDSWSGALWLMGVLLAVLWAIELLNIASNRRLVEFGIRPRELGGLDGIVLSPLLHGSVGHLLGNSLPFLLLGWFVLVSGFRQWAIATTIIVLLGGLATWLVAPSGLIVGVSGVVMGWLGYLLARAYFARSLIAIGAAIVIVLFFGSLLWGLLPTVRHGVSWQGHVCGFAAGIAAAWFLHARGDGDGAPSAPSRSPAGGAL